MAVGIPLGVVAVLILLTITGVIPGLLRGSRVLLFGDPSPSAAARVAAIAQNDIAAEIAIMDETDTVYAAETTGRCQTGLDLPCVRAMPEYAIMAQDIAKLERNTGDAFAALGLACAADSTGMQLLANAEASMKLKQGALILLAELSGDWAEPGVKAQADMNALSAWAEHARC